MAKKSPAVNLSFNFGASAKPRKPRDRANESKKSQRYRENVLGVGGTSSSGGT